MGVDVQRTTEGPLRTKNRYRVTHYSEQKVDCRWSGYRSSFSATDAAQRPCPKCGEDVAAWLSKFGVVYG